MHHHPGGPLTEINETEILTWHLPTPPSYWSIDFEDRDMNTSRYPALMAVHVLFMFLAFFVALPVGTAMRSVKHAWHGYTVIVFYSLCALGCAASSLYKKFTPDMYESSTHSAHGYFLILLSVARFAVDITAFFLRLYAFVRGGCKFSFGPFWRSVVLGQGTHDSTSEYSGLVTDDPEECDDMKLMNVTSQEPTQGFDNQFDENAQDTQYVHHPSHSSVSERTGSHRYLRHSDDTLHDMMLPPAIHPRQSIKQSLSRRVSGAAFATLERALVFAAFGMVLSGIVVYTGGCRESYINGCLAHLIKGGIFWCYGLFTFARFLGSHSEMGWAWNISPTGNTISAEFVESAVIFLYGITNTWMERFGAHSGDPYTTKQVQHISIAVMFWFAGLVGMAMESKRVRRWLAASAAVALGPARFSNITEPASYRASFNPFPALIIGVTGAAMSAHAQTYLFQVQIHQLWGWLLLGFSVLRCFTYFFLWLGPPSSVFPSRPPTEALGSFFLACGGLVFMFSTEEVTLAAMRKGHDDMMMFLNVAVAITCSAFCWTLCVVSFNGWLKSRRVVSSPL
ncbi:hypothetical protein PAXRUDRAFT_137291 [Paxillus rubicundulus Ve08.2h10]|uniref:Protein YTP1-like C-terminal domain-containing protein n=1 Tax=Paxillus rubicundulus Ve08.2h10 TaxID=930991 RepID=A0A0D0EAY9_9AGAM|nr:hypothetical protein PAXRUDRAFT_137291 [Paxillus rubicundulus Ve08.2h10]